MKSVGLLGILNTVLLNIYPYGLILLLVLAAGVNNYIWVLLFSFYPWSTEANIIYSSLIWKNSHTVNIILFYYLYMFVHVFTICTCLYLSFDDFSSHLRLDTLLNAANMHQLLFDFMINHNNYNLFKCDWCINCCDLFQLICKVVIRQLAVIKYL